jgi:hypothetical protein
MTLEFLIHSIVRQTAFLIAQMATAGGSRVPLNRIPAEVFLELVRQLEQQGVSRRVSADMFGLGLRTYQRKIQRVAEELPDRERSLWETVLAFIREKSLVSRSEVLRTFSREDEFQVRSVLHELSDSRLVFSSGHGAAAVYRAASEGELGTLREMQSEGLDELLWAFIYQIGPLELHEVLRHSELPEEDAKAVLDRLVAAGRVERVISDDGELIRAKELVVPLGATHGWEAAIFDHYGAVVATIASRLKGESLGNNLGSQVGGSTYSFDVSDDHPLKDEVLSTLSRLRTLLSEQRARVEQFNRDHELPENYMRVTVYAGQSLQQKGAQDREPVA